MKIENKLNEYKFMIKPALILSAVYLTAMLAILRANFYYLDDLGRAAEGYAGWADYYSRYISVFSSWFLHADKYLTDISPLPQIVAAIIMAIASVVAIYGISNSKKFSVWYLIAAIPMGLSPYFLECLTYKYDAPYMALSVLFSVFPILFSKTNSILYGCIIFVCTIGMCGTYQASAGIFPMLVLAVCIRLWVDKEEVKKIFRFAAVSALCFIVGLLVFRVLFVKTEFVEHSTTVAPIAELIPLAVKNYAQYIKNLISDFKIEWLILFILIWICAVAAIIFHTKRNRLLSAMVCVTGSIIMFLMSFGIYPALRVPSFFPRACYGVGCFISFMACITLALSSKAWITKATSFLLAWAFFVFAFTYGNALYAQKEYTDFRMDALAEDLVECGALDGAQTKALSIDGTIGYAPIIRNMPQDYQVLNRLVPVQLSNGWWGEYKIINYYGLPLLYCSDNLVFLEMPMLFDSDLHTIYANETYIWVVLH